MEGDQAAALNFQPSKSDLHNSIGIMIVRMENYVLMDDELRVEVKLKDGPNELSLVKDRNEEYCQRNEKLQIEKIQKRQMNFKTVIYFKVCKTHIMRAYPNQDGLYLHLDLQTKRGVSIGSLQKQLFVSEQLLVGSHTQKLQRGTSTTNINFTYQIIYGKAPKTLEKYVASSQNITLVIGKLGNFKRFQNISRITFNWSVVSDQGVEKDKDGDQLLIQEVIKRSPGGGRKEQKKDPKI